MVVIGTFEWATFRIMNKIPKEDAMIIVLVTVITVVQDLAVAVFAGLIVSALVFAWKKSTKISVVSSVVSSVEKRGYKLYNLDGPLFFGSANRFKSLFDYADTTDDIIIDFKCSMVYDHSAIEALNFVTEKYAESNKKVHLLNLSEECSVLLKKVESIVELSILENMDCWHLADDDLE